MTADEVLRNMAERVCSEPRCNYLAFSGYIYCVHHLYGQPERAPQEYIDAKKSVNKRKAKK